MLPWENYRYINQTDSVNIKLSSEYNFKLPT